MWTLVITVIYLNTMAVTSDTFIHKTECEKSGRAVKRVVTARTDNALVEWTCVK